MLLLGCKEKPNWLPPCSRNPAAALALSRPVWVKAKELSPTWNFTKSALTEGLKIAGQKATWTLDHDEAKDWESKMFGRVRSYLKVLGKRSREQRRVKWYAKLFDEAQEDGGSDTKDDDSGDTATDIGDRPTDIGDDEEVAERDSAEAEQAAIAESAAGSNGANDSITYMVGFDWSAKEAWRMDSTKEGGRPDEEDVIGIQHLSAEGSDVVGTWRDGYKSIISDLSVQDLQSMQAVHQQAFKGPLMKAKMKTTPYTELSVSRERKGMIHIMYKRDSDGAKKSQVCQYITKPAKKNEPTVEEIDNAGKVLCDVAYQVVEGELALDMVKAAVVARAAQAGAAKPAGGQATPGKNKAKAKAHTGKRLTAEAKAQTVDKPPAKKQRQPAEMQPRDPDGLEFAQEFDSSFDYFEQA